MLKRVLGVMAGAASAAAVSQARVEDHPFEVFEGEIDGRRTVAIVRQNGIAIAVEIGDDRAQIVRGLAAGAILSELRETAGPRADQDLHIRSGDPVSSVRVDGEIVVGRASRAETMAAIDRLPGLSDGQREELRALLALN